MKAIMNLKRLSCDLPLVTRCGCTLSWWGSSKMRVDVLIIIRVIRVSSNSTWTRLKKVIVWIVVDIVCHLKEMLKLNLQEVDSDEAFIYQKVWSPDFLRVSGKLQVRKERLHSYYIEEEEMWSDVGASTPAFYQNGMFTGAL